MESLYDALSDPHVRTAVSLDAVAEAEAVVAERGGLRGFGAQVGLDTINRLRPGFLRRHVDAMLPDMALAVEPFWIAGLAAGDGRGHLEANADEVTSGLLGVSDAYVAKASDARAIAVYQQLRNRAPARIAEQMPRIARFIERHTPNT